MMLAQPPDTTRRSNTGAMTLNISGDDGELLLVRPLKVSFTSDPWDCRRECADNTAFCLRGPLPDRIRRSMGQLYIRASTITGRDVLAKSQLMKIFNQTDDPCNRGDTIFADNRVTNEGGACILISAQVAELDMGVELAVPRHLSGSWSITQGGGIFVEFTETDKSPQLRFHNDAINRNGGGHIRSVSANSHEVLFETNGGCFDVDIDS